MGTHLAKLLVHENVETTLIDEDPERLANLSDKYDGTESNQISKRILDSCGISYRGMNLDA